MRRNSNLIGGLGLLTVFLVLSVGVMLRPDLAMMTWHHGLKTVGKDALAEDVKERARIKKAELDIKRIFKCDAVWMTVPARDYQRMAEKQLRELLPAGEEVSFRPKAPGWVAICVPSKHAKLFLCDELDGGMYKR